MEPGLPADQTTHEASTAARGPIYLIGPSSVGKGTLCAIARDRLGVQVVHIDAEFEGRERDWPAIRERFLELEHAAAPVLIDVGAGTQDIPALAAFLFERRERVVLVRDQMELAFGRNVAAGLRSPAALDNYREVEFTRRERLYSVAGHRIDQDGREVEAGPADEFCDIVERLLPSAEERPAC